MAAAVLGCIHFDPDVNIKGVILNRVAGPRHENILRKSMEKHCGIPVIGAVPRLSRQNLPERHMGLVPTPEHKWASESVDAASRMAKQYLDIDALTQLARNASEIPIANDFEEKKSGSSQKSGFQTWTKTKDRYYQRHCFSVLLSGKY